MIDNKFTKKIITTTIVGIPICLAIVLVTQYTFGIIASRHQTICVDNLRRISLALHQYISDNDDTWPLCNNWSKTISASNLSGCPSAPALPNVVPPLPDGSPPGYAYSQRLEGFKTSQLVHPQWTIAVLDYVRGLPITGTLNPYGATIEFPSVLEKGWKRHNGGGNYLFCDGHIQFYTEKAIFIPTTEICNNPGNQPTFCIE